MTLHKKKTSDGLAIFFYFFIIYVMLIIFAYESNLRANLIRIDYEEPLDTELRVLRYLTNNYTSILYCRAFDCQGWCQYLPCEGY